VTAIRCHAAVARVVLFVGMLFSCGMATAADVNLYDGEWHFSLTPYAWIPMNMNARLRFSVPPELGGSPDIEVNGNASTILSRLRFVASLTGEARKSDWAFAMDLFYVDLGNLKSSVRNVSGPLGMVSLPLNSSVDTNLKTILLQGIASYTAFRDDKSTLDVFGGVRYAGVKGSVGWNLGGDVGLLGRSGSLSDQVDLVDGIVGVRGQVTLGAEHRWFIPYYIDVGAGNESNTTWQGYAGAGYRYSWGDLVLVYRYLSYRTSGSSLVENLRMGGPVLAATFRW
jgi:hypothetical protein